MTPNNILNMAMLNQLDIIAITDHNSTLQLKTILELSESYDFIVIPGTEITVKENFDVLCYFPSFDKAKHFNTWIEQHLVDDWRNYTHEDQMLTDIYDNTIETYQKPLSRTNVDYLELYTKVKECDGILILAHIDRPSSTPLQTYKLHEIPFDGLEISPFRRDDFIKENPEVQNYTLFHSSDSHSLLQLHNQDFFIELEEKSIEAFFRYVVGENHE